MINLNFKDFSVDDLKELQTSIRLFLKDKKDDIKEQSKTKKVLERNARDDYGRHVIAKGKTLTVWYKDTLCTGTVTKVGEKTFTINLIIDGESKAIWRYFWQIALENELVSK